jgi:hypothetical protein
LLLAAGALAAVALLASCDHESTAPVIKVLTCQQLMQPLVDALWGHDRQTAESKLALPLTVVHQQYDVTDSEPPYTLGAVQTSTLGAIDEATTLLGTLASQAGEKDGDLVPRPRDSEDTSWDKAFVESARAGDLRRCAITLAVGDTEHVLIAGFEGSGTKIRALYWN